MKLSEIFDELLEARVTINDTANLAVIFISEDNIFLLIKIIKDKDREIAKPMGYIGFGLTQGDVYGIYGAYAEKGYGPLLYELVMTYVYPKGITMSDDSSTSVDAMNVWEKFASASRNDVEKKPIVRTNPTDKEEWFDSMYGEDPEQDTWIDRGRELHNTQFIYTFGMNKLKTLMAKGDEYLKQNPKTDVWNMVYSLER